MTITNGYATLAEFKAWFNVDGVDPNRDAVIEAVIEDTSREIDLTCGRVFYGAAPASVRYFTAPTGKRCFIDTCTSITALSTDDGSLAYPYTWTTSDYRTLPANGGYIDYIEAAPLGQYRFGTDTNDIKVTAIWGYNLTGSHPGPIRRACLLRANHMYERRKAPYGMTSVSELAPMTVIKDDPDVMALLQPYIKNWGG